MARALLALGLLALAGFLVLAPAPWAVEGGPEFFAESRRRPLRSNVWIGLWWAAALSALAGLALLATARSWALPGRARLPRPAGPRRPVWFTALVLAAVLAGVGLRLPMATKSLWWDEAWTLRQVIVGSYDAPDESGLADPERFRAGGLERALFYAKKPTNHALYSVAAWGTTSLWRAASDGPPHRFSELAFRVPALLAAVACIGLVALLCRELGFARAGPLAAWLFALHPWAIRYGAEGRAYGLVMTFTLLGALALVRFLRERQWRHLLLYAASQGLLVWTWPYAAFVTVGLGGAALACCLATPGARAERWVDVRRLGVAHAMAVLGVLLVYGPNLTLVPAWGVYTGEVLPKLGPVWAGLGTGMLWRTHAFDPSLPGVAELAGFLPFAVLVFGAIPLALAAGLVRASRFDAASRAVAWGWLAAPLVAMAVTHATGRHFYPRFLLFALPWVVCMAAIALDGLAGAVARRVPAPRGRAAGAALAGTLVAGWLLAVTPQLRILLTRPYAPLEDTVRALGAEPEAVRAGLGFGTGVLKVYDPTIRYVDDAHGIAALCREAADGRRPFYVSYGYPVHNRERAEAIALLEDERHFEPTADHRGIDPDFRFRVFRSRGDCPPLGARNDA